MAKRVPAKTTIEYLFQAVFQHEKDTKNKVRFAEDVEAGKQEIIGSLYLMKTFMPNASRVTVTASEGDDSSASELESGTVAFKFRNDTKNKLRYEEIVAEGAAPVIETLYVAKTALPEPPGVLVVKIEG
jgi:hypothetical protein